MGNTTLGSYYLTITHWPRDLYGLAKRCVTYITYNLKSLALGKSNPRHSDELPGHTAKCCTNVFTTGNLFRVSTEAGKAGNAGKWVIFGKTPGKAGKQYCFSMSEAGKAGIILFLYNQHF